MFENLLKQIKEKYSKFINSEFEDKKIDNNFSNAFDKYNKQKALNDYYVLFLIDSITKYNKKPDRDIGDLNKDIIYFLESNLSYNNYNTICQLLNSKSFHNFKYKFNHIYNLLDKSSKLYTPNLFEYLDFHSNDIFNLILKNSYILKDGHFNYYLNVYINEDSLSKNNESIKK